MGALKYWLLLGGLLFSESSSAQAAELIPQFNSWGSFIVAVGYLLGLILVFTGFLSLYKHSSEPHRYTVGYSLSNIIAGVFLLSANLFYSIFKRSTFDPSWGDDNSALALDSAVLNAEAIGDSFWGKYLPEETAMGLVGFLYLVGLVFFIKGIYLLRYSGTEPDNQQKGVGRALTHMVGGVVVMNIVQFSCIIGESFGVPLICMGG